MFNAKTFNNILSNEDCQYIIDTANKSELWESGGSEFWDNRAINYHKMIQFDKKCADLLMYSNNKCKEIIEKEYGLDKQVYSDTLQIIRWFEGMEQPPHADDMSNTDIPGFDHRVFGSIIYLNSDYSGGHTFYPNFNFEIIPERGKLAIHPGDPEHLHGVTKISSGMRYTIASFWTYRKENAVDWSIFK